MRRMGATFVERFCPIAVIDDRRSAETGNLGECKFNARNGSATRHSLFLLASPEEGGGTTRRRGKERKKEEQKNRTSE